MIIGICDDDRGDRACIREICEAAAQENKNICTFIEFENARDYWESEYKVDLLILETKMPEMTGIELKNKMQELHDRTMIIFVSNHVEMMPLAFGIHVYGFVDKCVMQEKLGSVVSEVLKTIEQYVVLEEGIDSRDIIYINSEDNYCRVNLRKGKSILLRGSLNKLERALYSVGFIRVHKTFLVNPVFVNRIFKDRVSMKNGRNIPISIRNQKNVKEKYEQYCAKQSGYVNEEKIEQLEALN